MDGSGAIAEGGAFDGEGGHTDSRHLQGAVCEEKERRKRRRRSSEQLLRTQCKSKMELHLAGFDLWPATKWQEPTSSLIAPTTSFL